jgi:hypothetical protein
MAIFNYSTEELAIISTPPQRKVRQIMVGLSIGAGISVIPSLLFALILTTAVTAFFPRLNLIGAPFVCKGTVEILTAEFHRPESGVSTSGESHHYFCTDEHGTKTNLGNTLWLASFLCYTCIAFVPAFVGVVMVSTRIAKKAVARERERIRFERSVEDASALVLSIEQTEGVSEHSTEVEVQFRLEVRPNHGAAYQAEVVQKIPLIKTPQIQPGSIVAVRIDPLRREHLEVRLK